MFLTVKTAFLNYTVGQQITDPDVILAILLNPAYLNFVVLTAPQASGGTTSSSGSTTTSLLSNIGPIYPDGTTLAINSNNQLYVISSTTNYASIINTLGYTPYDSRNPAGYITASDVPSSGVTTFNSRSGAITLTSNDVKTALAFTPYDASNPQGYVSAAALSNLPTSDNVTSQINTAVAGLAPLASPNFSGVPLVPTATSGSTTQQIANAAFVNNAIQAVIGAAPSALNTLAEIDAQLSSDESAAGVLTTNVAGKLAKASNLSDLADIGAAKTNLGLATVATSGSYTDLSNKPTAYTLPVATSSVLGGVKQGSNVTIAGDGTISVAASGVSTFNSRTGTVTLTSGDVTTALTYTPVNPSSAALTGTPTAPTATAGTSTTQIATTAFVGNAITAAATGVASFNSRTGAVSLSSTDVTNALTYTPAPTVSPTFTGTSTFSNVDINGGAIDGTVIGASSPVAGNFTTLTATTSLTTPIIQSPNTIMHIASAAGDQLTFTDGGNVTIKYNGAAPTGTNATSLYFDDANYIRNTNGATFVMHSYYGVNFQGNSGNILSVIDTPSSKNYVTITNAVTGSSPTITTAGGGTNSDLTITTQGSGGLQLNRPVYANAGFSSFNANNTMTGQGSGLLLTLQDTTNSAGVSLKLTGNGSTTPTKTIRVNNGEFQVTNDAISSIIFKVSDAGVFTATGGAVIGSTSANYVTINGSATGNAVNMNALGTDTNIGINLNTKGTGVISLNALTTNNGGFQVNGSNNNGYFGVGGGNLIVFSDTTNNSGVQLKLTGNGSTTPSKILRVISGQFQILNDASTGILSLTDAGSLTIQGLTVNLPASTAVQFNGGGNNNRILGFSDTANTTYGAGIGFTGDGATTPTKYIRAKAGNLDFVNSGYTAVIASLTDAGVFSAAGLSTNAANIQGGTINGTTIGATTASTGKFTTLTANTPATADNSTNVATTAFVKAQGYGSGGSYTLPAATSTTLGGVIVPTTQNLLLVDSSGNLTFNETPTFTGNVTIGANAATTDTQLLLNTAAGYNRQIFFTSSGSARWALTTNNGSESGSNAGSDFYLTAYQDNGSYLANIFGITRSTQSLTFYTGVNISSGSFNNMNAGGINMYNSAVNGTPVGNTTPNTGAFTTLTDSGTTTLATGSSNSLTITGGASGTGPSIAVTAASDTNADLNLTPVGSGAVTINITGNNQGSLYLNNSKAQGLGVVFGQIVTFGANFSWRINGNFGTTVASLDGSGNYTANSIQNTPIGSTTASTGAFTTLSTTGAITAGGSYTAATGNLTLTAGTLTVSSGTVTFGGTVNMNSAISLGAYGNTGFLLTVNNVHQLSSTNLTGGLTLTAATNNTLTITPSGIIVTPVTKTAAYTAVQTDNNGCLYFNLGTALAITLPTLTAGTTIEVIQYGAGKVTWTASGTTINTAVSGATGTRAQYSSMSFKYITSTIIIVRGDVA